MRTIFENLELYFKNNSKKQIEQGWAKSKKCDSVGPSVEEFIYQSHFFYELEMKNSFWEYVCSDKILENPKFTSDFFLS